MTFNDQASIRKVEHRRMKLYVDTADRSAAESLLATGLFTGVTTNPTILQRASKGVGRLPETSTAGPSKRAPGRSSSRRGGRTLPL